jgi:hypothetical protein
MAPGPIFPLLQISYKLFTLLSANIILPFDTFNPLLPAKAGEIDNLTEIRWGKVLCLFVCRPPRCLLIFASARANIGTRPPPEITLPPGLINLGFLTEGNLPLCYFTFLLGFLNGV